MITRSAAEAVARFHARRAEVHWCPMCEDERVARRGTLCGDCWEKVEADREREGETIHDTWEEARGER